MPASNEIPSQPLTEAERNAMRGYLQRAEVRLSTLHRIATAFIGGAGLLVLLPVFFKEEIVVLIKLFLTHNSDFAARLGSSQGITVALLYLCLIYVFTLSLSIPVYSLYLLLKDIIHFYFTIYTPGFSSDLITPSFALSGIAFSPDESPVAKQKILEYQYSHSSSVNFAIPFSPAKRQAYLDATIASTDGEIIPQTRQWEAIKGLVLPNTEQQTADRFSAAFGLARTLDRQLIEEVATSEISLVRHIIYLRRLVLRYVKTLLMFIWTMCVTFILLPFVQDGQYPLFFCMAVAYLIWALLVMRIIRLPLGWIYRHLRGIPDESQIDQQLMILETQVKPFCQVAIAASIVALVISGLLYFT